MVRCIVVENVFGLRAVAFDLLISILSLKSQSRYWCFLYTAADVRGPWMRVDFNILTPRTKSGMHYPTNSCVDCNGEGKPNFLNSLYAGSNRLAHSTSLSLCFGSRITRVTAIITSTWEPGSSFAKIFTLAIKSAIFYVSPCNKLVSSSRNLIMPASFFILPFERLQQRLSLMALNLL